MENSEIYVVRKKVFIDGDFKRQEVIAICDNKLDAFNHLVSGFVSLKGYYTVNYKSDLKDRISFRKIKECGCLDEHKEDVMFSVMSGKPNERFCLYQFCDMSELQKCMEKLGIFKA